MRDNTMRHAAAIAYYAVFSLPAILLIVLSVAGMTLGETAVNDELFGTMRMYLGERTTELLEATLRNIRENRGDGGWAAYAGGAVLILVATGVMRELQSSINQIMATPRRSRPIYRQVVSYLLFLLLLIATAAVLIASIVSGTLIGVLGQRVEAFLSLPVSLIGMAHQAVTYLAVTVMIFLLYLALPSRRFPPLIVLLSSVIVSSLLLIGTVAASYYVSHTGLGKAYGVAASVLILLFWIYFGANVFLIGAELIEVTDRLQKSSGTMASRLKRILRIR